MDRPPAPPPKAPAPPAPPPCRVRLLAVIAERESYRAMLYDPDTDRLIVVGNGDAIGSRTVERVTDSVVELRDETGVVRQALRDGGGGS